MDKFDKIRQIGLQSKYLAEQKAALDKYRVDVAKLITDEEKHFQSHTTHGEVVIISVYLSETVSLAMSQLIATELEELGFTVGPLMIAGTRKISWTSTKID